MGFHFFGRTFSGLYDSVEFGLYFKSIGTCHAEGTPRETGPANPFRTPSQFMSQTCHPATSRCFEDQHFCIPSVRFSRLPLWDAPADQQHFLSLQTSGSGQAGLLLVHQSQSICVPLHGILSLGSGLLCPNTTRVLAQLRARGHLCLHWHGHSAATQLLKSHLILKLHRNSLLSCTTSTLPGFCLS